MTIYCITMWIKIQDQIPAKKKKNYGNWNCHATSSKQRHWCLNNQTDLSISRHMPLSTISFMSLPLSFKNLCINIVYMKKNRTQYIYNSKNFFTAFISRLQKLCQLDQYSMNCKNTFYFHTCNLQNLISKPNDHCVLLLLTWTIFNKNPCSFPSRKFQLKQVMQSPILVFPFNNYSSSLLTIFYFFSLFLLL